MRVRVRVRNFVLFWYKVHVWCINKYAHTYINIPAGRIQGGRNQWWRWSRDVVDLHGRNTDKCTSFFSATLSRIALKYTTRSVRGVVLKFKLNYM